MMRRALFVLLASASVPAWAIGGLDAFSVTTAGDGTQTYTLTLQILILMTALTLLPAMLLAMTSFTRIIIVLAILRQALGTAQTPSNQILIGLALFMTFFIMAPVLDTVYREALATYLDDHIDAGTALERAAATADLHAGADARFGSRPVRRTVGPGAAHPGRHRAVQRARPRVITSELKTAFQIGFLVFLPFSSSTWWWRACSCRWA